MKANRYVTCQKDFYFIMPKSKYLLLLKMMLVFALWVGVPLATVPCIVHFKCGWLEWAGSNVAAGPQACSDWNARQQCQRYEVHGLKVWFKTQWSMWKDRKINLLLFKKTFCCYPRTSPVWLKVFRRSNASEIDTALHAICIKQINRVRHSP